MQWQLLTSNPEIPILFWLATGLADESLPPRTNDNAKAYGNVGFCVSGVRLFFKPGQGRVARFGLPGFKL